MNKIVLLIFFLCTCLYACKDDCPEYHVSPEAISYGAFKEGSWWIYQDDSTGARDCLYVTSVDQIFIEENVDKKCRWKGENICVTTKSNNFNWEFYYKMFQDDKQTSMDMSFDNCRCDFGSFDFDNSFINKINSFFIDSIQIQNKVYKDVLYSKEQYDYFVEVWISKNVGLIKVRSNHKGIPNFSLINYKTKIYE